MFGHLEDFTRCPKCESPYFLKNEDHVISKGHNGDVYVSKIITNFSCKSCGETIATFEKEVQELYEN